MVSSCTRYLILVLNCCAYELERREEGRVARTSRSFATKMNGRGGEIETDRRTASKWSMIVTPTKMRGRAILV